MGVRLCSYFQFCEYFWGPWVSIITTEKLLQGLIPHELTAYLSIFNLFKLSELWTYYQKHVNHVILDHTT